MNIKSFIPFMQMLTPLYKSGNMRITRGSPGVKKRCIKRKAQKIARRVNRK